MGAVIYTEGNVNIENSTFTNSSAVYGAAIFANNNANVTLKNNLFKDITADYETIYLNNTGISSLENNKYVNTSILMDITITPDKTESIHVNDTVNIEIATPSLANPNYYDENIVDDLTYYVYVNDELVKQTKDISYSIKINDFNNVTTYVLSDIGKTRSNLVKIEVEYDKIIDVELSTPDVVTRLGTTANFETTIQDEFGLNLTCGTLSYYNGENLIAQQNVNNKNRITQRTPDLSAGTYTITINYTDDTNKYQNKSITTTLTILDTLYASPDVTTSNDGTPDNPTTVEDAFSKVNNNMKIVLLKGTRGVYTLNKTLILNKNNVEIIGVDAILDGGNNVRILQPSGTNLRITNLTFINGKDTTTNGGGAIYTGSALTLTNVNFYNNTATRGGAISASNITLTGTNSFIDNKATSDGGALYVTGVVTSMPRPPFQVKNPGTLTVSGENTFINNTANNGGSIYHNLGTLSVINATFENSNAKEGGAIYSTASGYTVEIKNNKFINCSSNKDTLYIVNTLNTIQNNTYQNCSIVNTFTLTSDLDNQTIDMNTPVTVNMNLTIRNPSYYDANILDNNEYTIVINDENRYTTTESAYTFTPEEYGTLNIYTTTPILKTQTNNITIEVIKKEITVDPITAAAGETISITAKITVNDEIMTDLSKGKVSFKVNGKTLKDTNGKVIYAKVVYGTATIEDYLVPDTWKEGTRGGHESDESRVDELRGGSNAEEVGVWTISLLGAGYLAYRVIRMIPSLLPPFWWTIPINAGTP